MTALPLHLLLGFAAIALYLAASWMQLRALRGAAGRRGLRLHALAALLLHGLASLLGFWEEYQASAGLDLGLYPMLSLMALTIAALALAASCWRPVDTLFVALFPVAAVALACELLLPGQYTPRAGISGGIASHIALSLLAGGFLALTAAQALLLSFGDSRLKARDFFILRQLPSLETMEKLMFELLWLGLAFLTAAIGTGFAFLTSLETPGIIHHASITLAAWGVFALLLWGRHRFGWRGAAASRWALAGFGLLALGYFGSKLVLELILGRA